MKPSKLTCHFYSVYGSLQGKPLDYFQRLFSEMNSQEKQIKTMTTTEKSLLNASYLFSIEISKTKNHSGLGKC